MHMLKTRFHQNYTFNDVRQVITSNNVIYVQMCVHYKRGYFRRVAKLMCTASLSDWIALSRTKFGWLTAGKKLFCFNHALKFISN